MYTRFVLNHSISCHCSECILSFESSHGVHLIGIYRPETYLPLRGHSLPAGIGYHLTDTRGLVAPVFEFAK